MARVRALVGPPSLTGWRVRRAVISAQPQQRAERQQLSIKPSKSRGSDFFTTRSDLFSSFNG